MGKQTKKKGHGYGLRTNKQLKKSDMSESDKATKVGFLYLRKDQLENEMTELEEELEKNTQAWKEMSKQITALTGNVQAKHNEITRKRARLDSLQIETRETDTQLRKLTRQADVKQAEAKAKAEQQQEEAKAKQQQEEATAKQQQEEAEAKAKQEAKKENIPSLPVADDTKELKDAVDKQKDDDNRANSCEPSWKALENALDNDGKEEYDKNRSGLPVKASTKELTESSDDGEKFTRGLVAKSLMSLLRFGLHYVDDIPKIKVRDWTLPKSDGLTQQTKGCAEGCKDLSKTPTVSLDTSRANLDKINMEDMTKEFWKIQASELDDLNVTLSKETNTSKPSSKPSSWPFQKRKRFLVTGFQRLNDRLKQAYGDSFGRVVELSQIDRMRMIREMTSTKELPKQNKTKTEVKIETA